MSLEQAMTTAIGIIPWVVCVGFLLFSLGVYRAHRRWVAAPKDRVEAEIVRIETSRSPHEDEATFTPIYRFTTASGRVVEAPELGRTGPGLPVGSKVAVFHDRNDPNQVSAREGGVPVWGWGLLAAMNVAVLAGAWWVTSTGFGATG